MYEHNAFGYRLGLALCLTKVRSSRVRCPATALFYNPISIFKFQPFLDKVLTKKFRVALSRLRMSSHRLLIEAGRWTKSCPTPSDQCTICNKLEDEYHLLFECTLYNIEILFHFKPYYLRKYKHVKSGRTNAIN